MSELTARQHRIQDFVAEAAVYELVVLTQDEVKSIVAALTVDPAYEQDEHAVAMRILDKKSEYLG